MTTSLAPTTRLDVKKLAPHMSKAMSALDAASRETDLEPALLELVRTRASQLNGCAFCVDLHSRDARTGGEHERRLYALAVWREAPFFTPRERTALALTEAATRLTDGPVHDDVFDAAMAEFGEVGLADLLFTITVINAWNRLGATARPWAIEDAS